jgi:hypothetical protein
MKQVASVTTGDRVFGDGVEERCLEGRVISHRNGVWWNHVSVEHSAVGSG